MEIKNIKIQTDENSLIYQKSNEYRLHADKLRWTLLGGYAVFFSATVKLSAQYDNFKSYLALFILSISYSMILAVQNWFYNLFAKYVTDCEEKLINKEVLMSLEEFAQRNGSDTSPFHPAFFFALLICFISSMIYFDKLIMSVPFIKNLFLAGGGKLIFGCVLYSLPVYYYWLAIYKIFREWDKYMYTKIIKNLSVLFIKKH